MFLKCHTRRKDGKEHRYWSILEKRRVAEGKTLDRQVLYLGEINDSQRQGGSGWTLRKSSELCAIASTCEVQVFLERVS